MSKYPTAPERTLRKTPLPITSRTPAPSDEEAVRVWDKIMPMAALAGLIVQVYGGVATLATPEEQRKAGVRQHVLDACLYTEPARTPPTEGEGPCY